MNTRISNRSIKFLALALLSLAFVIPSAAMARNAGWQYLGQRAVDDRGEYDTIRVGADEGTFRSLKIRVDKAPVEIKRVTVHFGDGSKQTVERNILVAEGGRTPVLDLNGGRRVISYVVFYYEARSRGWAMSIE